LNAHFFHCLFGILGRPTVAVIERLKAVRLWAPSQEALMQVCHLHDG